MVSVKFKAKIDVFITKTGTFRTRVKEPDKPAYQVTIGGVSWNEGRGQEHKEQIFRKMDSIIQRIVLERAKLGERYIIRPFAIAPLKSTYTTVDGKSLAGLERTG